MRKYLFSVCVFLMLGTSVPFFVFATWGGDPYPQGETLNPECSWEDENCTVAIDMDSLWDTVDGGISYANGVVEIGGAGSGEFVGGWPSLLNIHALTEEPWGITFQNDETEEGVGAGMFLDSGGIFYIGTTAEDRAFGIDQNGNAILADYDENDTRYLNFGNENLIGEEGFGFRNNDGTMQFKNYGDEWTDFGSGDSAWENGEGGIHYMDGNVGIGGYESPNAALTIYQGEEVSPEEQIDNGSFDGDASYWELGDLWTYADGSVSLTGDALASAIAEFSVSNTGSGFTNGDTVTANGGDGNATFTVDHVQGGMNAFTVSNGGSGYVEGDTVTVNAGDVNGTIYVDTVDESGAITEGHVTASGSGMYLPYNYDVVGGTGSGAYVYITSATGSVQNMSIVSAGSGYDETTYNFLGDESGLEITVTSLGSVDAFFYQEGELNNGETYDVSLYVGGDTGSIEVCLDDGDCDTFDAGDGYESFSGEWWNDSSKKIIIYPSVDFNGTIDDVSVESQLQKNPGLKIIDDNDTSVSIGVDHGEITDAGGIKFTMGFGEYGSESATLFLSGNLDAHYGYFLPSLGEGTTDTFCMEELGNCGDGGVWNTNENGIDFGDGLVGIGAVSSNAKLSIDASDLVGSGEPSLDLLQTLQGDIAEADDVVVVDGGNYAYVVDPGGGFYIVDIADPSNMEVVDGYGTAHPPIRMMVVDDFAYVAEEGGAEILDISDPTNPSSVGSFDCECYLNGLYVSGDYMYVSESGSGIRIWDISDPENLDDVGLISGEFYTKGVVVSGDYAYILSSEGLLIYDISDPTDPIYIGSQTNEGDIDLTGKAAISGNYVYAINGSNDGNGFMIFDVSDPENPVIAGSADIGDWRYEGSILIADNIAIVADGYPDSVYLFDISDPTEPVEITHETTVGDSYGLALYGDTVFLADGDNGLISYTYDSGAMLALKTEGGDTLLSGLNDDDMRYLNFGNTVGSLGYGIRNNNGVMQYKNEGDVEWSDFSSGGGWNTDDHGIHYANGNVGIGADASAQTGLNVVGGGAGIGFSEIANYGTSTWSYDVVVSGDYAYAADGNRFDIVDVSDPEHGEVVGGYDFGENQVLMVRVSGDFAYVAVGSNIYTFDITDPTNPELIDTFEGWYEISDMQISNGVLYVTDYDSEFYTFDISGVPVLLTDGAVGTDGYPMRIAVSGHYAYIADDDDLLEIWDVSDPANPEYVGNYMYGNDSFSGGIAVKGNYVYMTRLTTDGDSFVVLDVSDPEEVQAVGAVDIGDYRYNTRVVLSGNIAYVADGDEDSIYAINISYPANPIIAGYGETEGNSYGVAVHGTDLIVADGDVGLIALHAPLNYSALFNGGNVGIGTSDPAFNLDVGAVKATATLTISEATEGNAFLLTDNNEDEYYYEFDSNESTSFGYPIVIIDGESNPLTLSKIIDNTIQAINNDGYFFAARDGNNIIIEQLTAGVSGNTRNFLMFTEENQYTNHPTHTDGLITLTDFTGGVNGDINFGGSLYQHGELFTGSQWTDFEGGISYDIGDVSIGEGSFFYDSGTGVTSIDNLSLGALTFPEDAGAVSWIDLPISGDATDGTVESYTASIGGISILTVYGEMDGGDLVNTGVRIENLPTSDMTQLSFLCMNGSSELVVGTNSDCSSSSLRFKDSINALTDDSGLAEIMKLNPVSFFYKPEFNGALQANPNFSGEQVGFIAEEVQTTDPRLITLEEDGTTVHGVRYEKITAILVKAVKEIGGWVNQFTTKKLCVGNACVTEAEFLQMIQSSGATPVAKDEAAPSVEEPEIAPEEENTPTPQNEEPQIENETTVPEEEIETPSEEVIPPAETPPTPEITPTPESEPVPEVVPEITPAPEQTPEPASEAPLQ